MKQFLFVLIFFIFVMGVPSVARAQDQSKAIQSTSASLDVRVAPGELLPISVKLSNFGGGAKVDVSIQYSIVSDIGTEISKTSETVAVETTNNFVKNIQIPITTNPGTYTAKTSITYAGQVTPATTEFTFHVERKILGIFQNDFLLYGVGALLLGIFMAVIGYTFIRRRSGSRFAPIDYSNITTNERVFYELISDTIMGMRQKVGDRALDVVVSVDGLTIDEKTGRVVKLTRSPSKIIAELVFGYEKVLGEKVSFSFRSPKD